MAFGFEYQEVSLSLPASSRVGTASCAPEHSEHRASVMLASSCQAVFLLIVSTITTVWNIILSILEVEAHFAFHFFKKKRYKKSPHFEFYKSLSRIS